MGSGDHAPAVVAFTAEMASVAVNEMIVAINGFQGDDGMAPIRYRRFHARDDRFPGVTKASTCHVCGTPANWGRADVEPFLDLME